MMGMVGQRVVNGVWQKVVQWMLRKQMVQRVDGRLRGRWGGGWVGWGGVAGGVIMVKKKFALKCISGKRKCF